MVTVSVSKYQPWLECRMWIRRAVRWSCKSLFVERSLCNRPWEFWRDFELGLPKVCFWDPDKRVDWRPTGRSGSLVVFIGPQCGAPCRLCFAFFLSWHIRTMHSLRSKWWRITGLITGSDELCLTVRDGEIQHSVLFVLIIPAGILPWLAPDCTSKEEHISVNRLQYAVNIYIKWKESPLSWGGSLLKPCRTSQQWCTWAEQPCFFGTHSPNVTFSYNGNYNFGKSCPRL